MTKFNRWILAVGIGLAVSPAGAATVTVSIGDTIQTQVNANPAGTTYQLAAGMYRMQAVVPKDGDTFLGALGPSGELLTTLSGARLLTGLVEEKPYWVATGQTQQGWRPPATDPQFCDLKHPRCRYPEDLYIDDLPQIHAAGLSTLSAGSYFFDYPNQKIYLPTNPAGRRVETCVTPLAFSGDAKHVTIKNLIVEKYASPNQMGAIGGEAVVAVDWTLDRVVARWNHGAGVRLNSRGILTNSWVGSNAEIGVVALGLDVRLENNDIVNNGYGGILWEWEGGGSKFVKTTRLIVRGNRSTRNMGPGLWSDADNIDTLYENNVVTENEGPGIFHEVSYKATIRNNIIKNNGRSDDPLWFWYSAIQLAGSQNVEIYGNTVEVNSNKFANGISLIQQLRADGAYGPTRLFNNSIHDNVITLTGVNVRALGVVAQDSKVPGDALAPASKNIFDRNAYYVADPAAPLWHWGEDARWANWQGFGQDLHGTVQAGSGPADTTPPVIQQIGVSELDSTAATIRWVTNEPADSQIEYGLTTAYGQLSPASPALVQDRSLRLLGLTPARLYHFRVKSKDGAGNAAVSGDNTFTTPSLTEPAFSGTPAVIPGKIEAENFDNGGEGVAYHDLDLANQGNEYRATRVDIKKNYDPTRGYTVGWMQTGEWMNYSVRVAHAGMYVLSARLGSGVDTGRFHVEFDGVDKTGPFIIQGNGAWETTQVLSANLDLTAGRHVMKVVVDSEFLDLDYIQLDDSPQTPPAPNTVFNAVSGQNVRAFPNPWRSDRHATKTITFDGLPLRSTIKLFTLSAHAVKTLRPTGPTAVWDLTNKQGKDVASGVYLYLINDEDTQAQTRGKIGVIR